MIKTNKKLIFMGLLLGLGATETFAQSQGRVEITGYLNTKEVSAVSLYKTVAGKQVEITRAVPDAKRRFFLGFYPDEEGIYVLGTGAAEQRAGKSKFYFKSGDKLSVNLTDSAYALTGNDNSQENKLMEQWNTLSISLYQKSANYLNSTFKYRSSTFVDFFPELDEVAKKGEALLSKAKTGNKKFDMLMKESMKWDVALYAATYNLMPHSVHPSRDEYSAYYDKLNLKAYAKSALTVYRQPWSFTAMKNMQLTNGIRHNVNFEGGKKAFLKYDLDNISNDTIKGDFILEYAKGIRGLKAYQSLFDEYGKYLFTAAQKKEKDRLMAPYAKEIGSEAFQFSLPDNNGKTVTMASLKGKVVLIDFWATWCAPCLYEIPFTQKLEEQLKGTDFQVLGVSLDEEKNKEKWKQMIKTRKIGGIQVFASGFGEIAQFYDVKTIPRYMVIDRNGKVVTSNSPRPSNPELKVLLEKTLAAK